MHLSSTRHAEATARSLRQRQTPLEARLWSRLRNGRFHHYKFRRQHPIGPWIVDFVCIERRLVIELDGEIHVLRADADRARDSIIEAQGFLMLRIKNHELRNSFDWCLEQVLIALEREID